MLVVVVKILKLYVFFNILNCISSLRYLSIPCNAFIACYDYVTKYLIPYKRGILTLHKSVINYLQGVHITYFGGFVDSGLFRVIGWFCGLWWG